MADDGRRVGAFPPARQGRIDPDRASAVASTLVERLLCAVREIEPTPGEWRAAVDFLTETGQISDARRQEFLLLSDVLGVSALVDAINARRSARATDNTILGPFYVTGAPDRRNGEDIAVSPVGEPLLFELTVLDLDGRPIEGARVDLWHASGDGFYENQQPEAQAENNLRGVFRTDRDGRIWCESVRPAGYPLPTDGPVGALMRALGRGAERPAHFHLIVSGQGYETLTTHLFDAADPRIGDDPVFAVKRALLVRFERVEASESWRVASTVRLAPRSLSVRRAAS